MSLLNRRRSRFDSLNTTSTSSDASKPTGIVTRVASIFSNKSSQEKGKGHSRLKSFGRGIIGRSSKRKDTDAARYSEWNVSDDSQEYEPSIRRPSGLGERKESTSSEASEVSWAEEARHRRRSTSEPLGERALSVEPSARARWPPANIEKRRTRALSSPMLLAAFPPVPTTTPSKHPQRPLQPFRLPDQVLPVILGNLSQQKIAQVALVSKAFMGAARQVLYRDVNLAQLPRSKVHSCLDSLGRGNEAADCVHAFTCLLEKEDVEADIILFKALRNMINLRSLTLSRLPLRMAGRRSRVGGALESKLTSFTLMETALSQEDLAALFVFLRTQPSVKSLSFPNLRIKADDPIPSNDPSVLPILSSLVVPPPLIDLLVPTRPVTNITINIYETLMDGLRPSAIMSSLPEARKRVTKLCLSFQETVDRRTVERALGAVEKECSAMVEELQVRWATGSASDLYKQVSAILPHFTVLRTLRLQLPASSLLAHSPPVLSTPSSPPSLGPSRTPSVAASLHSAVSRTSSASAGVSPSPSLTPSLNSKKSTHSIKRKPVPPLLPHELETLQLLSPSLQDKFCITSPSPSSISFPESAGDGSASKEHTRERSLLASWSKSNAALTRVEFVSGAEWVRRSGRDGGEGGGSKRKDKWTFVSMKKD
ncbi:hypothetical protein OE88DRAFT_1659094 [Heliocybe sulcata]|uniref:F-box domain-containing protein n=1 Tax=Heliocybe sulcata TaxID=5364 RepID=A0A5C3N205_9AGAM|nr:hypothetical protein OE88DRAFT_1659094 [Heliocybe sulcata]